MFKTRLSREILIANVSTCKNTHFYLWIWNIQLEHEFFQENGETKTVTEFQFFLRTSENVMSATAEFVDFLMAVRSFKECLKKFNAPLLVHCRLIVYLCFVHAVLEHLQCPSAFSHRVVQIICFSILGIFKKNVCVCVNSMQQIDQSFYFFKRRKWSNRRFYRSWFASTPGFE